MAETKIIDSESAMNAEDLGRGKSFPKIPVIDLEGCDQPRRREEILDQLRKASEEWGIFQIVNHGFPSSVIDGILAGSRKFHEQDFEMKKDLLSTDVSRKVRCTSKTEVYFKAAPTCWRDTFVLSHNFVDNDLQPEELPAICRSSTLDFIDLTSKLGDILYKLLAEVLGLEPDYFIRWGCGKGREVLQHYYPPWPEKELKLGTNEHSDTSFITVLLQDQHGGLQVQYDNKWLDVLPVPGAITVNLGDFFTMISNGKFKNVVHRVISNQAESRISAVCFYQGDFDPSTIYSPIQELISEENPVKYKEFTVQGYHDRILGKERGKPTIGYYKL